MDKVWGGEGGEKEEVGKVRCLEEGRRERERRQATNSLRQLSTLPLDKRCGRAALPQKGFTPIDKPQYILYR